MSLLRLLAEHTTVVLALAVQGGGPHVGVEGGGRHGQVELGHADLAPGDRRPGPSHSWPGGRRRVGQEGDLVLAGGLLGGGDGAGLGVPGGRRLEHHLLAVSWLTLRAGQADAVHDGGHGNIPVERFALGLLCHRRRGQDWRRVLLCLGLQNAFS